MASPAGFVNSFAKQAEDEHVILHARIQTEEANRKALELEHQKLERLLRQDASAVDVQAACSELVIGTEVHLSPDVQRFVLMGSFPYPAPVASVAVSSREVVALACWDGRVSLFDLARWRSLGQINTSAGVNSFVGFDHLPDNISEQAIVCAEFMPNLPHVLGLAVSQQVQIWDHVEGKWFKEAAFQHGSPINDIDFHEVQSLLASTADDGRGLIWDVLRSGVPLRTCCTASAELSACRFLGGAAPYELLVATAGLDGATRVWDLRRPAQVRSVRSQASASCLDCKASSHQLAIGTVDGQITMWDIRTWKELPGFDVRVPLGMQAHPRSLSFSPCGATLSVGCVGGELLMLDVNQPSHYRRVLHHRDTLASLAWSSSVLEWSAAPSHYLVCASLDGSWSCWVQAGDD